MRYLEFQEQACLITWARLSTGKYPEFALLHSSLNAGKRRAPEAARLKQSGMLAGIPDLFLPCARSGWHGLYIEMKAKGGAVTPIQKSMHEKLMAQNYLVVVCYSFEHAKTELLLYLADEKT